MLLDRENSRCLQFRLFRVYFLDCLPETSVHFKQGAIRYLEIASQDLCELVPLGHKICPTYELCDAVVMSYH